MYFTSSTFTLMQITDIHQKPKAHQDTIALIEKALDQKKPDLVVFTGDMLKGYSLAFRGPHKEKKVLKALYLFLTPLVKRNIPFTLTFGNHDQQAGLSKKALWDLYSAFPGLVPGEKMGSLGSRCVYLYKPEEKTPAFAFYLLDTGGKVQGSYEGVRLEDLNWFQSSRAEEIKDYGCPIPALVFLHIPLDEYYDTLKKVPHRKKHSVKGYYKGRKGHYILPGLKEGEYFSETPSVAGTNKGEFSIFQQDGHVLGIYCGHDHKNAYVRQINGIDLGYTPSCGFDEYGPGVQRGVRVFTFDKHKPSAYISQVVTYNQLIGKKVSSPLQNWFLSHIPTSTEKAFHWLLVVVGLGSALGIIIFLLFFFL